MDQESFNGKIKKYIKVILKNPSFMGLEKLYILINQLFKVNGDKIIILKFQK
jgi:hypothetical protein